MKFSDLDCWHWASIIWVVVYCSFIGWVFYNSYKCVALGG